MAGFLDGLLGQIEMPKFERIDLAKLQADARATALDNIKVSKATEQQYNPDLAESRGVLQKQTNDLLKMGGGQQATQRLIDDFNLGGQLPIEVQNQITAAAGGRAAGSGGPLGAVTARDIGQSALALRDKRTQDLLTSYNARANQAGAVQAANPEPIVGLDPGTLAGISVADTTALNNYNQVAAQIRSQNQTNKLQALATGAGQAGGAVSSIVGQFTGNTNQGSGGK
jgi:hypothetical protein